MQLNNVSSSLTAALNLVNASVVQPLLAGNMQQKAQVTHKEKIQTVAHLQAAAPAQANGGRGEAAFALPPDALTFPLVDSPPPTPVPKNAPPDSENVGSSVGSSTGSSSASSNSSDVRLSVGVLLDGLRRGSRALVAVHAVQRDVRIAVKEATEWTAETARVVQLG